MCEIRDLDRREVVDDLSIATDANNGITCPVPGCSCKTVFKRWGDMRGHFLDDSTHKKDYFRVFLERMHEPFCDQSGPGFNHGINSLMLALIRQPTSIEEITSSTSKGFGTSKEPLKPIASLAPARPKRARPVQEQQSLPTALPEAVAAPPRLLGPSPSDFSRLEQVPAAQDLLKMEVESFKKPFYRSAFSRISELVRDSDEINKTWRGKVWDDYVDMFHGIPPCFHCRSEEGKQIHHQNPLFHEIILVSLNKLGTTAEAIVECLDVGNKVPYEALLQEVFAFHMKQGKVCAVPYCQSCNQDAEAKRKRGKRMENQN